MLGLALLTFAVRAPGLFGGFVFDDGFGMQQRTGAAWSHIPAFFTTDQSAFFGSNFYRPVLNIWYEFVYALGGAHPAVWHLTSILLHVACTLLLFRLALRAIGNPLAAALAAALFAVHPAHAEAIAWASAVADPLWTLLALCSALAFLRWMEQGSVAWWIASWLAGSAAIFTKETAVVVPVVLLATVLTLGSRAKLKRAALATVPFFVVMLAFLEIRSHVLHGFSHPVTQATTAQMIFTWPAALLFYLRHMFWPSVVVPFYPLRVVQSWNSRAFFFLLAVVGVAFAALGVLLYHAAGWRKLILCFAWMLVPLAPALYLKAFVASEFVHDRFLYAPLIGFCLAFSFILHWLAERVASTSRVRVLPLIALALVPLYSLNSVSQTLWWRNNVTLFTRALTITPGNLKAITNLAFADMASGNTEQAAPLLRRAMQIAPQDPVVLYGMSRLSWLEGDNAAAEQYITQALRLASRDDMWLQLAAVELRLNKLNAAEAAARQAEAMNPACMGLHATMGAILLAKGDRAGAIREFQQELHRYPESQLALKGIAQATGNARR